MKQYSFTKKYNQSGNNISQKILVKHISDSQTFFILVVCPVQRLSCLSGWPRTVSVSGGTMPKRLLLMSEELCPVLEYYCSSIEYLRIFACSALAAAEPADLADIDK